MTDIIMVRGRASNRVGDALSQMLKNTKPVEAVQSVAPAGEHNSHPTVAPHPLPPQSAQHTVDPPLQGRSTLAGGDCVPSSPALSLVWDREQIRLDYELEVISEEEALNALMGSGMDVFRAMEFLDSWGG